MSNEIEETKVPRSTQYYNDNPEKRREHRRNWREKDIERARATDRKHTYRWREQNEEVYRDYQRDYQKARRDNSPAARFSHNCRTNLNSRQLGTAVETKKREGNLTNQHIIDIVVLYEYFKKRGFLDVYDYHMNSLLMSIVNRPDNVRLLHKTKNNKIYVEPQKRIRKVATKLEERYPYFCACLVEYLESIEVLEKED